MGIVVEHTKVQDDGVAYRLQVFIDALQGDGVLAYSMNRPLAEELIKLKPFQRTMQMQRCFNSVLESLPDTPIIKDIDVMFNPSYKIDVLKILTDAYKQKPFKLIWPGERKGNILIYSEPGLPDYKECNINNYDIMFIE